MLPNFAYVRPGSKQEALDHLGSEGTRIHAGGTDLLGCLRDEVFTADKVVSISGLEELEGIVRTTDGGLRIGALTTISEVAASDEVAASFSGLAQAAQDVASPQLRNQGTLGGNLCQRPRCWYFRGEFHCAKKGGDTCYAVEGENRYHAIFGGDPCYIVHPSDTAPMLVALGASVKIAGPGGEQTVALEDFFVLPDEELYKENVLQPGEMVTEIFVPPPPSGLVSSYRKARERGSWDFALASVALALRMSGKRVEEARVVLGGVAPKPWRS
ncbi:MAG: xanthine dehydrogenase family protein subunit M, partial [Thermoanaerobaculia bacterium]